MNLSTDFTIGYSNKDTLQCKAVNYCSYFLDRLTLRSNLISSRFTYLTSTSMPVDKKLEYNFERPY